MRRFPTSGVDRINLAGELHRLDLRAPLIGPRLVVLARGRCVFGAFQAPGRTGAGAAARAARLFAETAAPFEHCDWVIERKAGRFGVWWWDARWLREQLDAAGLEGSVRILPDPLIQDSGDGRRILQGPEGLEAQVWRHGALVASSWRRRPLDEDDWRGFIRALGEPFGDLERAPPAAAPRWRLRRANLIGRTQETPALGSAAVALAALLLGVGAYFGAQELRLTALAKKAERDLAAFSTHDKGATSAESQARDLVALKRLVETPDPLTLAEQAEAVLVAYGLELGPFEVEPGRMSLTLPAQALEVIEPVTIELEASPYFSGVGARREAESVVIEMTVQGADPPPG